MAFVVSTLGQTGPTRQLLNIIKHLNTHKFKANVVTLSSEPDRTFKSEFDTLNVPIYSLNLSRIGGFLRGNHKILELLRSITPDVIHTQGIRADLMSATLTSYPNRVATQRNIPSHDYPLLYGRLPGALFALLHRQALRRIPYLVSCSTAISEDNKRLGISSTIIRNGVSLDLCPNLPTQVEKFWARDALHLCQEGLVFIYTGPIIQRKHPLFLIKSFLNWSQCSRHQLCLLGDGALMAECRNLARQHTNIIVAGHIPDISPYLRAADVFLSASSSEGFPNSLLEALVFGLPVVLSEIQPHREIVERDPRIGQLFSLGNSKEFSNCLDLVNINADTRQAVRCLAESEYSAEVMANHYMNLYDNICSDR